MKWILLLGILCHAIPSEAQDIVAYNEPAIGSSASTPKDEGKTTTEVAYTDPLYHVTDAREAERTTDQQQSSSLASGNTETKNASKSPYSDEQSGISEIGIPTTSEHYSDGTSIPATKSKTTSEGSVETKKSDGPESTTSGTGKPVPTDRTSSKSDENATDGSRGETLSGHEPIGHDGTVSASHGTQTNSLEGSSNAPITLVASATGSTKGFSSTVATTKSRSDGRKISTADGAYIDGKNATQGPSGVTEATENEGTHGTIALDKPNSPIADATTSLYSGSEKTTYQASNESDTTDSSDIFNETLSSDTWNATTISPAESPCGKTDGSECSTQEIIDQNVKKCKRIFIISFVISLAILMAYTVFSGLHGMLRKKSKKL